MIDDKIPPEYEEIFRKLQYDKVTWSNTEAPLRWSRNRLETEHLQYSLSFSESLVERLRKSIFGSFLEVLNPQQDEKINENRFSIADYELKLLSENQWNRWKDKNNLFDNMYGCLKYMVTEGLTINVKNLQKLLKVLRLSNYYTTTIDENLKKFRYLEVLELNGNNLRDINGSHLPRNLRYLDLRNNFLTHLGNLIEGAPRHLIHLGLARNCLTDNSALHLLTKSENLQELRSIDLSDNDICDLNDVLNILTPLPFLRSLLLEGNICYLDPFYINNICSHIRQLAFLDNTEILQEDRLKKSTLYCSVKPKLIFQCYRVMGIPKPPPQKNAKFEQTIHIEVSLPLLEVARLPQKKVNLIRIDSKSQIALSLSVRKSLTSKSSIHRKSHTKLKSNKTIARKSIESNTGKADNIYESTNEYDEKIESSNFAFKSIRQPWSKVIEFPTMTIDVPNDNLFLLRDTLRSAVRVDIVYLLVDTKKGKAENIRDTKGIRLSVQEDKLNDNEKEDKLNDEEELKKEDILSKITLGSFRCNLEPWNWSDENLDFYWMNDPTIGSNGVKVEGSLKDLNYAGTKTDDPENQPQVIPKMLSCHVGFELCRDFFRKPQFSSTPSCGSKRSIIRRRQSTKSTHTKDTVVNH